MQIWVDGDACPNIVKEIIFRAAKRTQTQVILVANQLIQTPPSPFIKKMVVAAGFDVADNQIIANMIAGDLVVTADIPLADAVIGKGGIALNPRGELYSAQNIKQRLAHRDLNEMLRGTGVLTSGPAKLDKKSVQTFANNLDKFLSKKM